MKKLSLFRAVVFFPILLLLMFSVCDIERSNPLDSSGDNFIAPQILMDTTGVNVANGDTIHSRSATFVVTGNRAESRFQAQIDDGSLLEWQSSGVFHFNDLSDSIHTIYVNSKYEGGVFIVNDTINFFVRASGYVPEFSSVTDSVIYVANGENVTIIAKAEGVSPIAYSWIKNDTLITSMNTDTLVLSNIQFQDSGSYTCIASNEWGSCKSRLFKVKVGQASIPTYTVTYDGNGNSSGTVPVDLRTYEKNAVVEAKGNVGDLAKTGYKFVGWNTSADGLGVSYAAATDFYMGSENLKLFANWTQNTTYSVLYNGNGSDSDNVPIDVNDYAKGATVTVKGNIRNLTRTGFTFAGWNTEADGKGISYAAGADLKIGSENVILYANWTQSMTYTVVYDGNGSTSGTVPIDENVYEKGASVIVKSYGNLKKTGYVFVGWNTATDGNGTPFAVGVTFNIGSDSVKLFANWTQNPTCIVLYNGNGNSSGTVPLDVNAYEQNTLAIVKENAGGLEKIGYVFAGWNTAADGSGITYAAGVEFNVGLSNTELFAKWTQNATYTVKYNGNGNSGGAAPLDANAYEQNVLVMLKSNTGNLVRTGYTFTGWNTTADGRGTSYAVGVEFKIGSENVELYANWTQSSTYTVVYNSNGSTSGSIPMDVNVYKDGAPVIVKGNTGNLNKSGFTFVGWNTSVDGSGISYAAGVEFNIGSENVILYANWTQSSTYKVVYNGNGNTSGNIPVDVNVYEKGATVTVKENSGNLLKTGFTFAGWNTAADGKGIAYAAGVEFNLANDNVTFYAYWTQNETFGVYYNANGSGSGNIPVDPNLYEKGSKVTIKGNVGNLSRLGFTFAGWNTSSDGNGVSYAAGIEISMPSASLILYAYWTQNTTYTATYNGNGNTGGTIPVDANKYETGAIIKVKSNTGNLVKTGFTFAGWNSAANGSGTPYAEGVEFNISSGNIVFYANWTQNPTFKVTYNGNGNSAGSVPVDANAYEKNASVTVKGNTGNLVKTAYIFTGWNTQANGAGISYASDVKFLMGSENIVLYANWTQNPTHKVIYNGNGSTSGSVPIDANAYKKDDTVIVKSNTGNLLRTDYLFAGWNVAADGTGASFVPGAKLIAGTSDITLYAQWTVNKTYKITYKGNGNTDGNAPKDSTLYAQGAIANVIGNTGLLTRTGYTFAGWNPDSAGSTKNYDAGDTLIIGAKSIVLYAKWTINTYIIKYNLDGGVGTNPADYNVTSATIILVNPIKTGYTFGGWFTTSGLTGTAVLSIPSGSIGNKEFWAKWILDIYTITYNLDGGTNGSNPTSYNITSASIPFANPTKVGYTFGGWFTSSSLTGIAVTSIPSGTTGNKSFWAKWILNIYTITYNLDDGLNGSNPTSYTITSASIALANPTKTGYTFSGWFTDSLFKTAVSSIPIGSTGNKSFWAKWTEKTYTVHFNSNGGSIVDSQNVAQNALVTAPSNPTKTGSTFEYWCASENLLTAFDFSTPITEQTTLFAKWTANVYTVNFNVDGTIIVTKDIAYNSVVTPPADPTKAGYTFNNWYLEDSTTAFSFATPITGTTTLFANWIVKVYTVNFDVDGTIIVTKDIAYNSVVTPPADPTKEGYTFDNWYLEDSTTAFSFTIPITGTTTLFAKWIANVYTVTFDDQNADVPVDPITKTVTSPQTTIVNLPTEPQKAGFTFGEWWTSPDGSGTSFTGSTVVNANLTVYAKWIENNSGSTH
jgi:uncharacterized repeat protein (TIGR02543 family)